MRKVDLPCFAVAPISVWSKDGRTWRPRCSLELCHEGDHRAHSLHDLDRKVLYAWEAETSRSAREALLQLDEELTEP